jgi:hypothetical protein
MTLRYLDFEFSENTEGIVTIDAMVSVRPQDLPALQRELALVLDWAYANFPEGPGPADEGAPWDCDLQATQERSVQETLHYDPLTRRFSSTLGTAEAVRHTVTLSISGTAAFGEAFQARFGADEAP